jgi:hypothetical protein
VDPDLLALGGQPADAVEQHRDPAVALPDDQPLEVAAVRARVAREQGRYRVIPPARPRSRGRYRRPRARPGRPRAAPRRQPEEKSPTSPRQRSASQRDPVGAVARSAVRQVCCNVWRPRPLSGV